MLKGLNREVPRDGLMTGMSTCLECGSTTDWQVLIGALVEGEMLHPEWCSTDLRNVRHCILEVSGVVPDDSKRRDSNSPNYREDR
jgi:hypothetical protein